MKYTLIAFLTVLTYSSCKKNTETTTPPAPNPVSISDSAIRVYKMIQKDVDEVTVHFQIITPTDYSLQDCYLTWSKSNDFTLDTDSILVAESLLTVAGYKDIIKMTPGTRYYIRLSGKIANKRVVSATYQWLSDTINIYNLGFHGRLSKGDTSLFLTNFAPTPPNSIPGSKVFLGPYELPIFRDFGNSVNFIIPTNIPSGKYKFTFTRKNISGTYPDSVELLRGIWKTIPSPIYPVYPINNAGLMDFGTTYSGSKGYILGGTFNHGILADNPETMFSGHIYELDYQTETWLKKSVTNPKYFIRPICFYYNNSIYVIGGKESIWTQVASGWNHSEQVITNMKRLDLSTMTWYDMGTLPYQKIIWQGSFEINNEWYIGMGYKLDSLNNSGDAYPSKRFFKYSPALDQWSFLPDYPGGSQRYPTFFSINSKGYAFYGAIPQGTSYSKELWEYNTLNSNWTAISLPNDQIIPKGEKYNIITHNSKAYFLDGQIRYPGDLETGMVYPFMEWDPTTGNYKRVAMPTHSTIKNTVGKIGNKFYFQTDQWGYTTALFNKTFSFIVE